MKLVPEAAAPDHDVVVVGAGPAGLVTAIMLATQGIDVLLIERRSATSDLPRAVGVTLRQMELFRSWGLEQRLRAGGDDVELALLETVTAVDAGHGTARDLNVPKRSQSEVVSPTAPARVPQDHLEAVLMDHLATLPSATIRRGTEVTGVTQTEDGVRLERVRRDHRDSGRPCRRATSSLPTEPAVRCGRRWASRWSAPTT